MVFACQLDSFRTEFTSKVVSCTEAQLKTAINGKKEVLKGFEVVLEDTILFPEGGGQPCDQGFLDKSKVIQVIRRGAEAVHFVDSPLQVGNDVKQTLDWERRLDHMQQHSGQHLISALGENVFDCPTTAWWLGDQVSYVELDTTSLKQSDVDKWEKIANEKIRAALPVTVQVYDEGDPWLTEVRTRGLPDDHIGSVRVVTIESVDENMCCGTHVTNLSQLQAIKLLHIEKGKKNKTNLYFLVGNRVMKQLAKCLEREQKLTSLLKNDANCHADLVDKLQKNLKVTNKNMISALKELAVLEAKILKSQVPLPSFFSLHRKDNDLDFVNMFISEFGDQSVLLFLTVGDEKGAGHMVLHGEPSVVSQLGPKICEILNGKGAGKGPRYQAKVTKLVNRIKAEQIIKQHFDGENQVEQ